MQSIDTFFKYARDRYLLQINEKQGIPKNLSTKDDVLKNRYFCTVHREDDYVSSYIKRNLIDSNYRNCLLGALIIARCFNDIGIFEILKQGSELSSWEDLFYSWSKDMSFWEDAIKHRLHGLNLKLSIKLKNKTSILDDLITDLGSILDTSIACQNILTSSQWSLERVTQLLTHPPVFDSRFAFNIALDLLQTDILDKAPDRNSWVRLSFGTIKGLIRIVGSSFIAYNKFSKQNKERVLDYLQLLLLHSQEERYWPQEWKCFELHDIAQTLSEFNKYQESKGVI